MKKVLAVIICGVSLLFSGYVSAEANIPNLKQVKKQISRYYRSGAYNYDVEKVAEQAKSYLAMRIAVNKQARRPKRLAIVLDIDETALSNYKYFKRADFDIDDALWNEINGKGRSPAILPIKRVYQYAIDNDVTVFFITGRPESTRKKTEKNLKAEGYTQYRQLYLRPKKVGISSFAKYKTATRKAISKRGYDIVFSIGDSYSDLTGGYADRVYKLPNYLY